MRRDVLSKTVNPMLQIAQRIHASRRRRIKTSTWSDKFAECKTDKYVYDL